MAEASLAMTHNVIVDVLMTVFNGEKHLYEAVQSIIHQDLTNFHLHIVDDGSTDETPRILAELAAQDRRISIHRKLNGGVVEASNYGLQFCSAEFLARADADDILFPSRLREQIDYLNANPAVLAVSGSAYHIDDNGKRLGTKATFPPIHESDPRHIPATEPYLLHPFLTCRREALIALGGYRDLLVAEDSDLCWRLQERGMLANDVGVMGEYRLNPNSISSRSVRSGRIMAFYSQMAALSAMRRREGQPDILFDEPMADRVKREAHSLEALTGIVADILSLDERQFLEFSIGIKLMEMSDYRPYELESHDCEFIGRAVLAYGSLLPKTNKQLIWRMCSGTAARLFVAGRRSDARALLVANMRVSFLYRLAIRRLLPEQTRKALKKTTKPMLALVRRRNNGRILRGAS